MILLAIDLYGIRPFKQAKRIMLKPGLNAVLGENGSGKTMIYHVLSSVLFDAPSEDIAFFEDQNQQAAVTFKTPDGGIYRIARDYKKEVWNLSKKEAEGNKFTTLAGDRTKISAWLKTAAGGLDERERALLFMIDPPRLPSRLARRDGPVNLPLPEIFRSQSMTALVQGDEGCPLVPETCDPLRAKKEEELKTAQQKLDAMAEIDDLLFRKQDEANGIRLRTREIEEIKGKTKQMQEAELKKFSRFSAEELISSEQIQNFEADEKALAADFDTFEAKGQALEATLILKKQERQKKDLVLMIGLFLIIGSFLLPFAISLSGPLRYLFLAGLLLGSALSGFSYFKRLQRASAQNLLDKKLLALDERVRKHEQRFEKNHAAIYTMIKKIGVKDLSELKTQQTAYKTLKKQQKAAGAKIEKLLEGETLAVLGEKAGQLDTEVEALREQLKNHQNLTEEVYRLQEALRETQTEAASPDTTFSGLPGLDGPEQTGETSFFSTLLEIGKNGTRPSRERLEHNAGILFRRFQPQNNEAIQVGDNGEIKLGESPLHHMSPGLADQIFLSLALSSLSQFTQIAFPIFLDEPFETLDPASRDAAIKILQVIAKRRQVILFTTHPEFARAEQVVALSPKVVARVTQK